MRECAVFDLCDRSAVRHSSTVMYCIAVMAVAVIVTALGGHTSRSFALRCSERVNSKTYPVGYTF